MMTSAPGQYGEKIQKNAKNACTRAAMIPTHIPNADTEEHHDPGEDDHGTDDQVDPSPGVEVAAAEQQRVPEGLLNLAARMKRPEAVDRHVAASEDHHDPREDDPACPAPPTRRCFDHDQLPFSAE